jgi:branched-chain amino acid transport system ATP-binding protein
MSLLEVSEVTKTFGGLTANDAVSLRCESGEVLGIIGPNGAGKTTLLNCINGLLPLDSGRVVLEGQDITGLPPHKICVKGIARTFQIVQVVDDMTALQNVMVGAFLRNHGVHSAKKQAEDAIEFAGIGPLASAPVGSLTLAQKRKVEFARALATQPRLVLLDELLAGLNSAEMMEMTDRIKRLRDQGLGVVWIEHVMEAIMPVADRIFVLHFGRKLAEGRPCDIATDAACVEAYLGEESHVAS